MKKIGGKKFTKFTCFSTKSVPRLANSPDSTILMEPKIRAIWGPPVQLWKLFFYLIFIIDNTERRGFSIISIWNNHIFCRNILDEFILLIARTSDLNVTQTFGCDPLVCAVALPLVWCASWGACGRIFFAIFRFLFLFFNFGVDLGSFPLKVIWFLYCSSLNLLWVILVRNLRLGWNNYKRVIPWCTLIHTKHSSETLRRLVPASVFTPRPLKFWSEHKLVAPNVQISWNFLLTFRLCDVRSEVRAKKYPSPP